MKRKLSRFGQGQRLQVVHEAGEQMSLIQRGVDVVPCWLVDTVDQAFEVSLNDVKWRAQFMCDIGSEVAALLFGTFQVADHFVEALDQLAELRRIVIRHADGEIPLGNSIDGLEDLS